MYNILASCYDDFMDNVDYSTWIEYVTSFLGNRKLGVDLACGSGAFTIPLAKQNYNIFGIDISHQMLNMAIQNAQKQGVNVNFCCQDIINLNLPQKVDFALTMCDGINYIKNPQKVFKNVYNYLNDNGVYIFDISSEYKLINILGNNTFSDSNDKVTYIWHNYLDKKKKCIDFELTFFKHVIDNFYQKFTENQTQYIHKTDSIIKKLYEAGFSTVKVYGNITHSKPKDTDERIHFIAYK